VDATAIAREHVGVAIVNTAMLGALAGATGMVSLDSIKKAIASTLPGKIVDRNIAAAEAAYKKVKER
jgi:pyruvate ferredoxin oxidoreductase gamma subunit